MEIIKDCKLVCKICQKEFSSISTKNRHIRTFHDEVTIEKKKIQRIRCPLCLEEEKFGCCEHLMEHLKQRHKVSIMESVLSFRNFEDFEAWRALDNRDVDYACYRRCKRPNGNEDVYYNCNRSDSRGFTSTCHKRNMKLGGSIRIEGTCPSRIVVKIQQNGMVEVKFVETHVGHADELRSKRLSKTEQDTLVQQLTAGVTKERIITNSRIIENDKLQRINIITRGDLAYLIRKFNIDKRRNADDMIATALKIEEWNRQEKNNAFLFKQIGERYPGLRDEDFVVGYMNSVMEKKLKEFKRVICIDGTHGTNRRNWDLTVVLVKDENNMGFPVAFLLSNRLDQVIQEIFFSALKSRLRESVEAEYIMSDDDIKYYNAWTKVMETERKPRRLLCMWHIIKYWNIQGRSKLKKPENRQEMKMKMRNILKEVDIKKFLELKQNYFKHLEEEGENEFLKYLQNYYFQSEERIMMWAHCHRINAGINTNMAIESLNKLLKYNKMNGQRNLRVEKLLDLLDELVDEKMWKRIINTERPNANNYQHKITVEAHKKAEQMKDNVQYSEFGTFKVQSCTVSNKFYLVSYNEICDEDCRTSYCSQCKICIHRYLCECPEYAVKCTMCKHIHAVVLFEERSESVLGLSSSSPCSEESNVLYIDEPTTSQIRYQDDLTHFLDENCRNQNSNKPINFENRREIALDAICRFGKSLDEESFDKFMMEFNKIKDRFQQKTDVCRKRKIEKQLYYPNKK